MKWIPIIVGILLVIFAKMLIEGWLNEKDAGIGQDERGDSE